MAGAAATKRTSEAKTVLSIYVPLALLERAKRAAKKVGTTRNQFIGDAIERAADEALATAGK
jgi:hypothetical protein